MKWVNIFHQNEVGEYFSAKKVGEYFSSK